MRKEDKKDLERFSPSAYSGLNDKQVEQRINEDAVNKTSLVAGKTVWEIIRTNILTFFNLLLIGLAILMIYGNVNDGNETSKWYSGLFFLIILASNIVIGVIQDIRAKVLMKKMKLITTQAAKVIRNGKEVEIDHQKVVLDDILILHAGDQICSDSYVLEGELFVDESLLTGESVEVIKKPGDLILSGTYVRAGSAYAHVDKVGKDNYVETLSKQAKAVKQNPSHILKSLKRLFRVLGITIITMIVIMVITYASLGKFSSQKAFVNSIVPLTGQFVAMIPAGLYLLTSFTLATGVLSLYKRNANVQDLYSIEMLARADVLCVDKTGTITDGTMVLQDLVSVGQKTRLEIEDIIGNLIKATKDENQTAKALANQCKIVNNEKILAVLPFDSANKYSGVTFSSGVTYIIGAAEYINLENKSAILQQILPYISKGLRVMVLARGNKQINGKQYNDKLEAECLIILKDHVKETAKETFEWFGQNNVEVKVISGDNAITVSEIAKSAGIPNADKYISLEGMSLDQVKEIASLYTVFGRVTPEQKEAIVISLKEKGNTVAMTGDGVNDMLALKRADCSIAMNSGAQAAKNVSHIVLLNNDFSTMPEIVAEGRRVINNVERTGSLFLVKTIFAIIMSALFWILSIFPSLGVAYPFSTRNLMVWEVFGIGASAFFISLERNPKPITKGFLRNILLNAIPSAIVIIVGVGICFLAYILQKHGVMYTAVYEFGFDITNARSPRTGATALSIIVFTGLSLMVLFNICRPINKYRGIVCAGATIASAVAFGIASLRPNNMFDINFTSISYPNLMLIGAILVVLCFVLYNIKTLILFFTRIFNKKRKCSNEN